MSHAACALLMVVRRTWQERTRSIDEDENHASEIGWLSRVIKRSIMICTVFQI